VRGLAEGLWQLGGFPPNAINVYVIGDVLVDAATRYDHRRILRQLSGRGVATHALTHAHPDHQGSSKRVCETLRIPYWVGAEDVEAAETGAMAARQGDTAFLRWSERAFGGPGHPVDRALREGDEVAGFSVLDTPGHSPGHVAYWRESDRSLVLGDVLFNQHPLLGIPGLRLPPEVFTADPARNLESVRRIAELEPALVCFGHGPPLRDPEKLRTFVDGLA
jgi:glyoxylase-like metal-dependent hydrolase (beta-lactamase superfamily II)